MIPLSKPHIFDSDINAVTAVLRSGRLSIGPNVEAFEVAVADRAGRKYGIAVNSGTSGLHLALEAMEITNDVITTPFSFVATTNAILMAGARPVFVDVDESYNMDPNLVGSAVSAHTEAILPVSVFGNMEHHDEYDGLASKHGLEMIEDSCESLGGPDAGSHGGASVFAFYPNKQITAGEGGMIVTDNEEIRDRCRAFRNHGKADSKFGFGYNYRMDEMSAALGLSQIKRLSLTLARRMAAARYYDLNLLAVGIDPPPSNPAAHSWFAYVIQLPEGADRAAVIAYMRTHDVETGVYFPPINKMPHVMDITRTYDCPVAERLAARSLALPFFTEIAECQIERVVVTLAAAITFARKRANLACPGSRPLKADVSPAPARDYKR